MIGREMMLSDLDTSTQEEKLLYTKMAAAEIVGVTAKTLKVYRKLGLVNPHFNGRTWLYSANDVKWLCCLRKLIHADKLSIEALKKLLSYAPCWELRKCSGDERARCQRSRDRRLPGADGTAANRLS